MVPADVMTMARPDVTMIVVHGAAEPHLPAVAARLDVANHRIVEVCHPGEMMVEVVELGDVDHPVTIAMIVDLAMTVDLGMIVDLAMVLVTAEDLAAGIETVVV